MNKFGFKKLDDLVKANKPPDISQIGEDQASMYDLPWEDKEYNYRINPDHDVNYIVDKDNNALGHFALDEDNVTRSVYVDPKYRGQGLGYKAHEALASKIPIQMDDANEPEIYKIWDKLKSNYPDKIEQIGMTAEGKPRLGFTKVLESLGKGKFRAVAPFLAGGAGLLASGASEAFDAESAGNPNEQDALEREIAAQKQMSGIEKSTSVPEDVKLKALELFKKNKLPY